MFLAGSTATGQFYFGRNKIQYHPFDWHILTTEHFEIYYYEEEEELASAGAFFAEEAFKALEKRFNFTLVEKVPLIFYSSHLHFQQTNTIPYLLPEGVGGFFEFIKGRVVIPYDGSTFQFRRVIWHELVHVFMHNKIGQILRLHNIQTYRSPPLWFTEGLAEYWSTGWDTKTEMVIRDALLNDYLVPLRRLDLAASGFLLYKEGQSFLRFLEETYGQEKILLIMEAIWWESDFYKVIESVLEKPFEELAEEWKYFIKKRVYPILGTSDSPSSSSVGLTVEGINAAPTYYGSDEERVIFLTNRMGYSDIYAKSLGTDHPPKLLLQGERKAEFESLHLLQSRLDVNGGGQLVFSSKSGATDMLNILEVASGELIQSVKIEEIVSISSPVWSEDGHQIAFSGITWSGHQNIYVVDVTQMKVRELMDDFYADRDPSFSPDGGRLVFSSDRNRFGDEGVLNLFLYNLSDSTIHQLTEGKFHDSAPSWSNGHPDRIVFTSDRDGTYNLWMLELATDTATPEALGNRESFGGIRMKQLTQRATGALDPRWAGEANDNVLFTAFEKYRFQIHLLENVDSLGRGNAKRLPSPSRSDSSWVRPSFLGTSTKGTPRYRKKFSLDIAQTAIAYDPVFGFLGGAQVSVSDLLGNDYYHFLLFNTAETTSDFWDRTNIAVTHVDLSRRINLGYGLFHFAGDYFTFNRGLFFERRYGAQFALSYPFSVFKRVEVTNSAWQSERELYLKDERFSAFLVSNSVSYVFDNSIWGPVGPVDGTAFRVTVGQTMDFSRSRIYYSGLLADFRKYFRTSIRTLYALRVMTWLNTGEDLFRFHVGGSWGLRGYPRTAVAGTSFLLINNEFRFPFADQLVLKFRSVDFGLAPLRGALFLDVGNAWTDQFPGLKGSVGLGLRGNLLGAIVLRLDVGKTTDFQKLSKGFFSQFFFGWNY